MPHVIRSGVIQWVYPSALEYAEREFLNGSAAEVYRNLNSTVIWPETLTWGYELPSMFTPVSLSPVPPPPPPSWNVAMPEQPWNSVYPANEAAINQTQLNALGATVPLPTIPQAVLDSQTSPTPLSGSGDIDSGVSVEVNEVVDTQGKLKVIFNMNVNAFTDRISSKMVEAAFASQAQLYLTTAIAKMLKTEEFEEILKPKIREHLLEMSLADVMELTNQNLSGIMAILGD